jgi:rubrerythrin
MDWKIFISTFGLIFLAELGDKTQFAVMAATASKRSVLSIFLGASLALILSTLIAIAAGTILRRFVPDTVLQTGAGLLFLIFGAVILFSVFRPGTQDTAKDTGHYYGHNVIEKSVLRLARSFEENILEQYRELSAQAADPEIKKLADYLIAEEESHLKHLSELCSESCAHMENITSREELQSLEDAVVAFTPQSDAEATVVRLLENEKSIALFYEGLAQKSKFAPLKHVLMHLAQEEQSHINHLRNFLTTYTKG